MYQERGERDEAPGLVRVSGFRVSGLGCYIGALGDIGTIKKMETTIMGCMGFRVHGFRAWGFGV